MHKISSQATEYLARNCRRRIWMRVVSVLACIVVFCTTYALILPAITMENTICGLAEHIHTEECYEAVTATELVCSPETLGIHTHTDTCYDEEGNPVCGYADFVVHTHDGSCYDGDGNLICTLPEIEAHTHTEACFAAVCNAGLEEQTELSEPAPSKPELADGPEEQPEVSKADLDGELEEQPEPSEPEPSELEPGEPAPSEPVPSEPEPSGASLPDNLEEQGEAGEPELICGREEIILHTHEESCFDENGNLTCGKVEIREHQHSDDCFRTVEAKPVLICGLEEHTHTEECIPADTAPAEDTPADTLTEEEQAQVDEVIALIDALPTSEEVEAKLDELDAAGDYDGYEAYYLEVRQQALAVYIQYEALGTELYEQVLNRDKLLKLEWLWSSMALDVTDTVNVTAVNSHNYSATIIYHDDNGMAVRDNTSGEKDYKYWYAVRVEYENGRYVVTQVETNDGSSKGDVWASGNGFVLLFYPNIVGSVNVSVGDTVTISSDFWKTKHSYDGTVWGTVTFTSSTALLKPEKDNTSKLTIVPGADTKDLIEVNLYDYGNNINDLYNNNTKYPGFRQEYGSIDVGTSFSKWMSFNFGNNITSDLAAGKPNITNQGGNINTTTGTYNSANYGTANIPISGAMSTTLGSDGYPALADDTSLSYLFSNNTYAEKKNSTSINGLFQHNEITGAYTFNSRENHAQFNADDDTFTLYRQILSPNFMMYPFGNFLPFNDITKLSAQTSTIDRAYLEAIANSAQYKANNGAGDAYGTLATQLTKFIGLMDAAYPNGWVAADCMNEYFKASGISKTFSQNEELLQNLYSLDYDEPTDFYFGMEMKMNFMQPKGGLTGADGQQPMVFYFTGDDDVWVYLDGKLFLDLSGIHRHVGGEIDFVNGLVKYYSLDVSTGDVSSTPYKTVTFEEILGSADGLNEKGTFKDYSTHSFNFYYMERGSGSGVCRMNFNFPLLRKNSISVTKELSVDEQDKLALLGNPDFRFQVLQADSSGGLFIGAGVTYNIYDSSDTLIGTGTTDANGVFTLKAGQRAEFTGINENAGKYYVRELLDANAFEQYGKVFVDGTSQTTNYNVTIGSDQFKGLDSTVKDVSDGTTVFHFNNQVTFNKLGSLEITKKLETYPQARTVPTFDFEVTLDGAPLPVGTAYTVGSETRTVETAGIITVPAGATAKISNILAGSQFIVKETTASGSGYTVTYSGSEGVTTDGQSASGTILVSSSVQMTVTNGEKGASVTIPVGKTISNPDGTEHTFSFRLEQVTDEKGNSLVTDGTVQDVLIPVTDKAESAFTLTYLEKDLTTPATFYYKITEIPGEGQAVDFDESVYVAKVTASSTGEGIKAEVTGLWKDGTEVTRESLQASFANTLLRDLTIQKKVSGVQTDTAFTFEVTLQYNNAPLSGTFRMTKSDGPSDITFTDGKATITLKADETITIHGLPYGAAWTVRETAADGYRVSWKADETATDGNEASGTVDGSTIICTNTGTYELPQTGGAGTGLYTMGGALLMAAAGILWHIQRKRRKEEPASS